MIIITPIALSRIKELMSDKEQFLRVFVQGGGCSGFQYGMQLEEIAQETDTIFDFEGIKILVDPISKNYTSNAQIDLVQSVQGDGFVITDPAAISTCGCGQSFKPK